jgi:putative endonuclease
MHDYYVYILANKDKAIYIGVTNNLRRRVYEHKTNLLPGFSKTHSCNVLVHFEHFTNIKYAIAREKQLKSWRRAKKVVLIELKNKLWREIPT